MPETDLRKISTESFLEELIAGGLKLLIWYIDDIVMTLWPTRART
jgi:hypothetical protein